MIPPDEALQRARHEASKRAVEDIAGVVSGRIPVAFVNVAVRQTRRVYVLGPDERSKIVTFAQKQIGGRVVPGTLKWSKQVAPRTARQFWVLGLEMAYTGHRELAAMICRFYFWLLPFERPGLVVAQA